MSLRMLPGFAGLRPDAVGIGASWVASGFAVTAGLSRIGREHAIAFVILLGFLFSGETFLSALGLSSVSLQLAGGVVLFLIAIRMIFPPTGGSEEVLAGEPFIVPLAVPAIAGPSSMATVMLLVSQQPARILEWAGALTVAMMVSLLLLLGANRIQHLLGDRFVLAMEKLMGL
ncbi:MAG: hypothetical protein EBZ89_05170, partial [Chloroflexi bacterium]|nr:hypothetical protein [Chloroflexota bacterium]